MLRFAKSRQFFASNLREARRLYRPGPTTHGHLPDAPTTQFMPPAGDDHRHVQLINAYRRYGYLAADLDLLGLKQPPAVPELDPKIYGLEATELANTLKNIYCGPMAIEFMHINNWEERQWLATNFELLTVSTQLTPDERKKLCLLMNRCENFDNFLALKFPTVKRYGSEGAESMYGFFLPLFYEAPETGIEQIFIGIAHRGRLNLLNEMMQFPTVQMFRKMKGKSEFPDDVQGAGDVLSHLTSSFDLTTPLGGKVHISMLPNPSHLEAVNPVAMGKSRARAQSLKLGDYSRRADSQPGDGLLCALIHGDGAFTGQGIVWESLALSRVPHFRLGGSLHLITNNQVAFTAERHIGRSTQHCTDVAKAFEFPVLHVNGDYPEAVVKATRLAMAYREKFRKDVFINLICYRRWGHNELDDPKFTQPLMYKAIDARESVPGKYSRQLIEEGIVTEEEIQQEKEKHTKQLMEALKAVDQSQPSANHLGALWNGYQQSPAEIRRYDTGVKTDLLQYIGAASVAYPPNFAIHQHLKKTHCDGRIAKMKSGEGIDWATAEELAFGSLLVEGNDVRISGQDVGRGTFSHRHAMLVDQETDKTHYPLNDIHPEQKNFLEVANNLLSEEAILGFEYGFSLDSPRRLCIWEAQFGDFFNGAQIIIDTFVASGESKWLTQSGLVLLLPHGYDGAGPEHSSCRIERFLQLTDSREDQQPLDSETVNMRVANPTTAAQYFHLLRRQLIPPYRKPLVVVAPKILLRHPKAASRLEDFAPGTYFQEIIGDSGCQKDRVKKIIFVSGKFWLDVEKACQERGQREQTAILRLESLCPFPAMAIADVLKQYPPSIRDFVWAQEEPRNAGGWSFVKPRFANALGIELKYAGRPELAWTATAIAEKHNDEKEQALKMIFD